MKFYFKINEILPNCSWHKVGFVDFPSRLLLGCQNANIFVILLSQNLTRVRENKNDSQPRCKWEIKCSFLLLFQHQHLASWSYSLEFISFLSKQRPTWEIAFIINCTNFHQLETYRCLGNTNVATLHCK